MSADRKSAFFADHRSDANLGRQSLRSGAVSVASRAVSVFVQIGSTIVLARLLSPEDFGLVAMVAAFTGFIPVLSDLGTRDAAVQRPSITEHEVSALFWLTLAIGATLGLALVLSSSLIASFYHEPRLRDIALASAAGFVVAAASCQHFALLRRAMRFRSIALIEVGSNLFSSIAAIGLALLGAGYWALVAKPILLALFTLLGALWSCRWLPGLPRISEGVREMVRFGLNVTGFTMADYASRSVDRVAIGYRSGSVALGFYQQALFVYENLIGLLSVSLHPVAVASLSKLSDDPPALRRAWAKAIGMLSFFGMPLFALLAVTAQDVLRIVLGPKWEYTALLVSVLALRGIPHVVERTLGWLHVPAGRADRWMRWGLVGVGAQMLALACGLPFGVMGVVVAYVILMYVLVVPSLAYAGKPLGIRVADIVAVIGPPMLASLAAAACGFALRLYALQDVGMLLRILLVSLATGATYLLLMVVIFRRAEPLRTARRMLQSLRPRALQAGTTGAGSGD